MSLSNMSKRVSQHYLAIILGLTGGSPLLWASDFNMDPDFLAAQPHLEQERPGLDIRTIRQLPPQTLSQLIERVKGASKEKKAAQPPSVPASSPTILVQSPRTGGKLAPVHPESVVPPVGDDEILAEAKRLTQLELPALPARALEEFAGEDRRPLALERKTLLPEQLILKPRGDQLEISPQSLNLLLGSKSINVSFDPGLRQQPQIFLRETKVMHWDASSRQLTAHGVGRSEIFITYRNQMYILPVEVLKPSRASLLGENQRALEHLTSVLPTKAEALTYQPAIPSAVSEGDEGRPLTLANSAAEVDATRAIVANQQKQFVYPDPGPDYRSLAVQVVDERSVPEQSLLYPVSGVTVRLFGSQIAARSDAKGHAVFGDLPSGSRFWVGIQDEKGEIVPTVTELSLARGSKHEVLRARTMNYRTYYAYQSILELAQDNQLGSVCARAMNQKGDKPLDGMKVRLNVDAEGPFYVGQFGPQREFQETDRSGRFCFFNVSPGLVEMSFYRGNEYVTALTMPIFPGAHTDEDLPLENSRGRRVFLAALPNAMQQIYEDAAQADLFQAVDAADMLAIGENENLARISPNVVGHEAGYTNFKGRLYTLAQAPEFENVLYALDRDKEWTEHLQIVPLLQRGFVEDLFHELNLQDNRASIAFDPALGQALVYHTFDKSETEAVKITLVDSTGRSHDDAWYFGNPGQGNSKAVFFNLQPGVYQVKVENVSGGIVALDTIGVDYWTTAFAQTGSSAQFSVAFRREEEEARENGDGDSQD